MRVKSSLFNILRCFTTLLCNQFNTNTKVFHSNGDTELTNNCVQDFFVSRGVFIFLLDYKPPFEILFGSIPNYVSLKVFMSFFLIPMGLCSP